MLTALALFCFALLSYAERLMPMEFIGQPLMLLEKGNPQSCGIRIVGIQTPLNFNNPNEVLFAPDGSFMFDKKGYGLVKALAYQITVKDVTSDKAAKDIPFKSFWFKADNFKATTPIIKPYKGEQKYSLLYATEADSVIGLYNAVLNNEVIKFALKFENASQDVAYYGKVSIKKDELQQVVSCMDELTAQMSKEIDQQTVK